MQHSLLQAREAITVYMSDEKKQHIDPKLLDSDWEKMSKCVKHLDLLFNNNKAPIPFDVFICILIEI